MSKQDPLPTLSEADIRAVYAQGEEAVVSLVTQLLSHLNRLETRVNELEDRLSKNSRNSSKPPSSDGFGKRTKSLRKQSDKPSGGQKGHRGQTLQWREHPEETEYYPVHECCGCGVSLSDVPIEQILSRQVFDIPPIELQVKEHQVEVKCCPQCGMFNQGVFAPEATNVVQYGPRLKSMMVYLMEGQLLPSHRVSEVLSDLLNVSVSEGTLYTTREQCFKYLEPVEETIHQAIVASKVVHFDETGSRVNQQLWWLHVASTNALTYYQVHPKRGRIAMDAMGILPKFEGKAVHDGWKSYQSYECEHFLCNYSVN